VGKIKRGGFLFISWIGDHAPRHVHIIKNSRTIAKWDLDRNCLIEGKVSRQILKIIRQMIREGKL
jgi:hypothetical protein